MNDSDNFNSVRPHNGREAMNLFLGRLPGKPPVEAAPAVRPGTSLGGPTLRLAPAILLLALFACTFAWPALGANVTITGASGGGSISADTAAIGGTGAYTTLGAITIAETANGDFKNGNNQTMTLKVPAGFAFNTAQVPDVSFTPSRNITAASVAFSDSSTLVITFSVANNTLADTLTIGGTTAIQVRPTAGTPLATGKHIYLSAESLDTAGTTTSPDGSSGSNFGDLTEVTGALHHFAVSAATPVRVSTAFITTVTAQDQFNNTVTTDNATVVAVTSSTGNAQFDSDGNGTFGDNTKTLSSGTFSINTKDNAAETITLTATGASKTGTSGSVLVSATLGDFRSRASGTWATAGSWETNNGTAWVTASTAPSSVVSRK